MKAQHLQLDLLSRWIHSSEFLPFYPIKKNAKAGWAAERKEQEALGVRRDRVTWDGNKWASSIFRPSP